MTADRISTACRLKWYRQVKTTTNDICIALFTSGEHGRVISNSIEIRVGGVRRAVLVAGCREGERKELSTSARTAKLVIDAGRALLQLRDEEIMRPDDANIAGNVHGGTILKMIEEAGVIISTRHCNSQQLESCAAVLARVERTDFLSPMSIGEVAHVSAEITYTSKHSVEVQVNVLAEDIIKGKKRLTNRATLWYVPVSLKSVDKVVEVPPIKYLRTEQEEEGRKRYDAQKLERMENKQKNGDWMLPAIDTEPYTVRYSQSSLIHLVSPSDCVLHGFVQGGVTMKLMDEVAGIVAARHCKTNIVTASVDAINFHHKIQKGCVLTVSGRMTFTSNKSMEIEVFVDIDPVLENSKGKTVAVTAFFTYVSLDKHAKPLSVPMLKIETEDEKKRFEEGESRYQQTKAKRLAQAQHQ
eukprot:gi/632967958/ref/XP_007900271.1/ PREDICTED: cytosolic acyl coenzyme A thioester hydrolase isoform X2 [Callorhinchus milii]